MKTVTRNDIINLSLNNPELYTSLEFWRQGYCTFEEALMACVVVLVESNNNLFRALTEKIENEPNLPAQTRIDI